MTRTFPVAACKRSWPYLAPHAPVKPPMILKGNQRGSGQQLATQLLNADNNQRVEILELRGSVAQDLHGAFEEWSACAMATQCLKYLYSLSINPDPRQGGLTRAQYFDLIERTEKELGLSGQPHAVVLHVHNDGREHYHVVWSRIDIDNPKAVHIAHDRLKIRVWGATSKTAGYLHSCLHSFTFLEFKST